MEASILKLVVNTVEMVNAPLSLQSDLGDSEWHNISVTTLGSVTYLQIQGGLQKSQDFHASLDITSLDVQTMVIGGSRTLPSGQLLKGEVLSKIPIVVKFFFFTEYLKKKANFEPSVKLFKCYKLC